MLPNTGTDPYVNSVINSFLQKIFPNNSPTFTVKFLTFTWWLSNSPEISGFFPRFYRQVVKFYKSLLQFMFHCFINKSFTLNQLHLLFTVFCSLYQSSFMLLYQMNHDYFFTLGINIKIRGIYKKIKLLVLSLCSKV